MPGTIRVRYDRQGEAILSREDMLASGDADLKSIAAASIRDNPKSRPAKHAGWLTTQAYDKTQVHYTLMGGYQRILQALKEQPNGRLTLEAAQSLMAQGAQGPFKLRAPPVEPPLPTDIVRAPKRYDASKASPKFLESVEHALSQATAGPEVRAFRGFMLPNYGGPELVRYLRGDFRQVIASRAFTSELRARLNEGGEFHDALAQTATHIKDQAVAEISRDGFEAFSGRSSQKTTLGTTEKYNHDALGLAHWLDTPLTPGERNEPGAFGYAALSLTGERTLPPTHPMIVIDVRHSAPERLRSKEFHVPSHVPPTQIERFFLGFSNWNDAHQYIMPPRREDHWYQASIIKRDVQGRPSEMAIRPVHIDKSDGYEVLKEDNDVWSTLDAKSDAAKGFLKKHPLLQPTIDEIVKHLP